MDAINGRQLISCSVAGKRLNVTGDTVRKWLKLGKIEGLRIGGSTIRVYADSVEKLLGNQGMEVGK
jgi:excisionase family DNA binding protein